MKREFFQIKLTRIQAERLAHIMKTESLAADPPWCHDAYRIAKKLADVLGWTRRPKRRTVK